MKEGSEVTVGANIPARSFTLVRSSAHPHNCYCLFARQAILRPLCSPLARKRKKRRRCYTCGDTGAMHQRPRGLLEKSRLSALKPSRSPHSLGLRAPNSSLVKRLSVHSIPPCSRAQRIGSAAPDMSLQSAGIKQRTADNVTKRVLVHTLLICLVPENVQITAADYSSRQQQQTERCVQPACLLLLAYSQVRKDECRSHLFRWVL